MWLNCEKQLNIFLLAAPNYSSAVSLEIIYTVYWLREWTHNYCQTNTNLHEMGLCVKTCLRHLQSPKAQTSLRSLTSAIVIFATLLKSVSSLVMKKISIFYKVPEYQFVGNPKTGLLAMLAPRLNYMYLNSSDRFSCVTAQLIAGYPSIKYPIHKHSKSSGQMAQSPYRATILQFFLPIAESILSISLDHIHQWRQLNFGCNADIRYSKITEISLNLSKKKWKERNNVNFCLLHWFSQYAGSKINFSPFHSIRARRRGYI